MHEYLRSIGFKGILKKADLRQLKKQNRVTANMKRNTKKLTGLTMLLR